MTHHVDEFLAHCDQAPPSQPPGTQEQKEMWRDSMHDCEHWIDQQLGRFGKHLSRDGRDWFWNYIGATFWRGITSPDKKLEWKGKQRKNVLDKLLEMCVEAYRLAPGEPAINEQVAREAFLNKKCPSGSGPHDLWCN